jgi:hypothetical protein
LLLFGWLCPGVSWSLVNKAVFLQMSKPTAKRHLHC